MLTRALRRWRAWVLSRRRKAQRQADADAHHAVALRRRVLTGLKGRRALVAWKAAAEGVAAAFRRRWALRSAVRRWRVAAAWCGAMRAAGAAAMGAARERLRADTTLVALQEWRVRPAAAPLLLCTPVAWFLAQLPPARVASLEDQRVLQGAQVATCVRTPVCRPTPPRSALGGSGGATLKPTCGAGGSWWCAGAGGGRQHVSGT